MSQYHLLQGVWTWISSSNLCLTNCRDYQEPWYNKPSEIPDGPGPYTVKTHTVWSSVHLVHRSVHSLLKDTPNSRPEIGSRRVIRPFDELERPKGCCVKTCVCSCSRLRMNYCWGSKDSLRYCYCFSHTKSHRLRLTFKYDS